MGVSADHFKTLEGFVKANHTKHLLLSDFRRQMLPAYDALVTDPNHPLFRYAKRVYFILDKTGTVKYVKIMDNPLNLIEPSELLAAVKQAGA